MTLSIPEAESLWELATLGDSDISLRFLDEATRDPISLSQLRARAEPALIGAVGLDESRRSRAVELLEQRMRDPERSPVEKVDVAFIALELAEGPGSLTEKCAGPFLTDWPRILPTPFGEGGSSRTNTAQLMGSKWGR